MLPGANPTVTQALAKLLSSFSIDLVIFLIKSGRENNRGSGRTLIYPNEAFSTAQTSSAEETRVALVTT